MYMCVCVCSQAAEATDVQSVNDFILFTVAGLGSLASGFIYSGAGWNVLIYCAAAMVGC